MALSHALLANAVDPNDLVFKSSFERCDNISTQPADAVVWDGGGGDEFWSNPENWKGDEVPDNGDDVWIADSGGITIIYNSAPDTISLNTLDSCESLKITGGTLALDGTAWVRTNLELTGGNLVVTGGLKVLGQLQQSSGTLKGTGTVTVARLFTWTGGSQSEGGVTVANSGMQLSGGIHFLNTRTLTLNAASTYSGGMVRLQNTATINNNGPFSIQTDDDIYHYSGTVSTLNNSGTITKSTGTGETVIGADIYNSGSIAVTFGSLSFGKTFEQTAAGTLEVRIASGGFDNYTVTDAAILNGTLNVSLDGGFDPGFGVTFEIMTVTSGAGSVAGTFANETGMTIGVGKKFVTDYTDPKKVVLEVVPDP